MGGLHTHYSSARTSAQEAPAQRSTTSMVPAKSARIPRSPGRKCSSSCSPGDGVPALVSQTSYFPPSMSLLAYFRCHYPASVKSTADLKILRILKPGLNFVKSFRGYFSENFEEPTKTLPTEPPSNQQPATGKCSPGGKSLCYYDCLSDQTDRIIPQSP